MNGEDGETEELEIGEPSCSSKDLKDSKIECDDPSNDLRALPTQNILSILDIKTDCDTNGDGNKNEVPSIDLTITL